MSKIMRYERTIENCLECPFSHDYVKYGLFKTERLGYFCTAAWYYVSDIDVDESEIMHVGVGKNMDRKKTYVHLPTPDSIPKWCPLEDKK